VPENLEPPRAASRILSYFGSAHLPQILGDLMEEFNERVQSTGLSAARRWYWRATLRNIIALTAGGPVAGKARPKTLFLISGVWFGISLFWVWLSHRWLKGLEHESWGIVTVVVFLVYLVVGTGWLVPMLWAIIRLVSHSRPRGVHPR